MYVHEYLVHMGAQKAANSFLQEVNQNNQTNSHLDSMG